MPDTKYTSKVFVSYSRSDSQQVLPLVERLERETGVQLWIDRDGIESAEQFEDVIIRAIDQAEVVLFMLSDNSQHSHWTKDEVSYAKNIGKRVVPIVLNGSDLHGWFLFKFGRVNYIDALKEEQLQRLVKDLRQWLKIGKEPAPTHKPKPKPAPAAPATPVPDGKANDDESNSNVTVTDTRESIQELPPTPSPTPWNKTIYAALALLALVLVAVVFVPWSSEDTPQNAVEIPEVVEEAEEEATQAAVEEPVVKAGPVAETGGLSVQYTPSGAAVYVDGAKKGKTPCEVSGLQPGSHTVKISLSGYESVSRTVEVKANVTREISGALAALAASVASTGAIAGHEWVDLGLSVKWATCNVGASSPEGYGDYYAWGETSTKSSYDRDNCATWEKQIGDIAGTSRDVARVKWGGSWRMPTLAECQELWGKCTWEWTTRNGVSGNKVMGPNGNSIFLPAAGSRGRESLLEAGKYGNYWSSTPYKGNPCLSHTKAFSGGDLNVLDWHYRNFGLTVRPVTE